VAIFPARGGAAVDASVLADVSARVLAAGLKLGLTTGPQAGPLQVAGAATFRTGTVGANGQKASVGVLVKLEASGSSYRLTVRAAHGKAALAYKNVVKAQLA
jgi:hypothetical protein